VTDNRHRVMDVEPPGFNPLDQWLQQCPAGTLKLRSHLNEPGKLLIGHRLYYVDEPGRVRCAVDLTNSCDLRFGLVDGLLYPRLDTLGESERDGEFHLVVQVVKFRLQAVTDRAVDNARKAVKAGHPGIV